MGRRAITPSYSLAEEVANSVIHGVGLILAVGGFGVLTAYAALYGDAWHIFSCSVFGAALVLLYTASTLYHAVQQPRAKAVLRVVDHAAIFILIAGTYTPFMLVSVRGAWGWTLFVAIWTSALLGVLIQAKTGGRSTNGSLLLYVSMGWGIVVAIRPLIEALPEDGIVLLVAGGLCYTAGIVFFCWRRLVYHHAIWHLFVLAGSVLHYFAVLLYVIPTGQAA